MKLRSGLCFTNEVIRTAVSFFRYTELDFLALATRSVACIHRVLSEISRSRGNLCMCVCVCVCAGNAGSLATPRANAAVWPSSASLLKQNPPIITSTLRQFGKILRYLWLSLCPLLKGDKRVSKLFSIRSSGFVHSLTRDISPSAFDRTLHTMVVVRKACGRLGDPHAPWHEAISARGSHHPGGAHLQSG